MSKILPDWLVGSLAGLALGFLASISLVVFIDPGTSGSPHYPGVVLGLVGAVCGGLVGARLRRPAAEGGTVARWCVGTAAVVGGAGFLAGFVGPTLLRPDSPQGPLLGIFFTGPLGAVVGAAVGAAIGLARQNRLAASTLRGHRG